MLNLWVGQRLRCEAQNFVVVNQNESSSYGTVQAEHGNSKQRCTGDEIEYVDAWFSRYQSWGDTARRSDLIAVLLTAPTAASFLQLSVRWWPSAKTTPHRRCRIKVWC
jgi:hypothetical protein